MFESFTPIDLDTEAIQQHVEDLIAKRGPEYMAGTFQLLRTRSIVTALRAGPSHPIPLEVQIDVLTTLLAQLFARAYPNFSASDMDHDADVLQAVVEKALGQQTTQ